VRVGRWSERGREKVEEVGERVRGSKQEREGEGERKGKRVGWSERERDGRGGREKVGEGREIGGRVIGIQ
jgi:hypothetical protein